jgi:hypothetical protein
LSLVAHVLGLDGPSYWSAFWGGFGSCISEFSIPVAAVAFWYHHTCHVSDPRFCWRWAAHPVEGTPFRACRRHHPAVPEKVTAEHIQAAHDDAQTGGGA